MALSLLYSADASDEARDQDNSIKNALILSYYPALPGRVFVKRPARPVSIGNAVLFDKPFFWGLPEWQLIALVAGGIIEALLIAGLLVNRARRRQVEEALRQKEERLLLAQRAAKVGTWEWNLITGESRWSEGIYELLGLEPGDGNARVDDFIKYIHPEDREQALSKVESAIKEGEYYYNEFRIISSDGAVLWLASKGRVIRDESGKAEWMIGVNIDITARKLTEEALRKSERRIPDLLRTLPDLMFVQTPDGTFLDFYADDKRRLFVAPAKFLGKNVRDVMPPELAAAFLDCFRRARETGELQVHEYALPMGDEPRWFEARIIYTASDQILSIVRDITARKLAESQLIESEERFRNMADTAPVMIWVADIDKRCTYLNKQWLDFTGRTLEEELGSNWAESVHPDDYERCIETYNSAFDRRESFTMEYRLRRRDGEFRWVYDAGVPRLSLGGKFLGYIGSCIDVTDSKRAEEALRESQAQLAEIIGTAMDAIITIGKSQRIILFNNAAEQLFGYSAQEAIGRPIYHFLPERCHSTYKKFIEEFANSQMSARPRGTFDWIQVLRADGEVFPVEASISKTELSGQKFFTIIVRDITQRQKAERALKESEANYRAIFNGINVAIFVLDKNTGAVLEINQKAREMFGVTAEEARSLKAIDLSADELPDMQETAEELIRKAAAGEPQLFEWRAKDRQGRVFWVEVSLRYVTLEGIERVLAMVYDITARKQAEGAREEAFAQVSELKSQLEAENIYLKEEIKLEHNYDDIIGKSEAIKEVFLKIERVATTNMAVLILGETGTGKELVARAIHSTSPRQNKPMVKVNCGALPATLIESELFGHERGAFTGAMARQIGRFELANGGTIFLDEIGDLPMELQVKLLRVLQEGEFERLGSGKTIKVDARVIAATNRDLPVEVRKGRFREDLWYRLNVFPINVPPLRERKEDIPLLIEAFAQKFSKDLGKTINAITPAAMRALQDYSWPGNIRELANVIERAVINTEGPVLRLADQLDRDQIIELPFTRQTLEEMERQYILQVLGETGWRIEGQKGAARILGLHPSTLRTRMAKLGIRKPGDDSQLKLPSE